MNVAYDHRIFAMQRFGGVSRYFTELARHMAVIDGVDVSIISPLYVNSYLHEIRDRVRVTGVQVPDLRYTRKVRKVVSGVAATAIVRSTGPDLVHETYYGAHTVAPRRSKVVVTVYDMIHELFSGLLPGAGSLSQTKRAAVERADHVICISQHTCEDLITLFGVPRDKISVIHLGFSMPPARAEQSDHKRDGRPFLLHVGVRGGYKNFEGMLKAFAGSPDLRRDYDIVAFGGGPFTPGESGLISSLGLPPGQVRQLNGPDEVLASAYRHASALVCPSLYEGFGIPPLEAMSLGCPVVCSNASVMPEVVGDGAELCDAASPDELRHALVRVLSDASLRSALIARGYQRIKVFSWEKCAQETLAVYKSVLS